MTKTRAVGADRRLLGHSGIEVSALGLGCWTISGVWSWEGRQIGWGQIDDEESIRAIRAAIDLGVNFFDLGDCFGSGHGEYLLGKAIAGRRDKVVISTKFGNVFEEGKPELLGEDASPSYIRRAVQESLRRLGLERIDLYSLEIWSLPKAQAEAVADTLEELKAEGLIGAYGWSTDDLDCARVFASRPGCAAIEHELNVFQDAPELLAICDEHDLASINRAPLAMGILSGRFTRDTQVPDDDVRGRLGPNWYPQYFQEGRPSPELLEKIDAVREILTSGGRTLVQGALAWIWGRSERTIPIPGFRNLKQAEENARALELGPLEPAQMKEIAEILAPID